MNGEHDEIGSVIGDARKRRLEELRPNHDEVHGHADIDWNIVLGED